MAALNRKPYIVYWNNIPAPYMVDRFNAVADRGNFEFEAWFNDRIEQSRSWIVDESNWRFRYRYLPVTSIARHKLHWPIPLLKRKPDVLVSLYGEPAFVAGWCIAHLRRIKTCFRVLMTHDRLEARHPIKEALKRFLFNRVDAIESPGEDGKLFAMHYGAQSEKIFFATHTVNIAQFVSRSEKARAERERLRAELKLKGIVFIYVGRLLWSKGLNYLLEAFRIVQQQVDSEVTLMLVGDGPEEIKLRQICEEQGIQNIAFAGFQQNPDLPPYYAVSDVFVFPTLGDTYGLVVDEAMACSLPIISTSAVSEIHSRVEDAINGYIVPPEDSRALANRMLHLVNNPELLERMGKASAEKVVGHTPEQWAKDFEKIIYRLVAQQ
ncbi:MAG: glycosyltransferase family 4 protein [Candidatus Nitrosoglobus sp.]